MTRRRLTWKISLAVPEFSRRADTHRRSAAADGRSTTAHARTTQDARIHELGTEADNLIVISTQHGCIDVAGTTDGLVARGRCVIPQGSIPAAVRVEANAAGLVGVRQRAEARGGRLAVADLGADVGAPGRGSVAGGAVAASRCSALPGGGIDELLEAGLLGRFDMAATPYTACRKSASVDYRIGKIGGMNFGAREEFFCPQRCIRRLQSRAKWEIQPTGRGRRSRSSTNYGRKLIRSTRQLSV